MMELRGADWTVARRHALAQRVREHVVRMAVGEGCFLGASLSCVDLLVQLYTRVLHWDPRQPEMPERDLLLFSKGHDVPALYGLLAELEVFDRARLGNHLTAEDDIYWHPNAKVPGIEFHSGSLGHLISVGIGMALDLKLSGSANRTFVVLGDGELNEGSIWEAVLAAGAHQLSNLVAVVDRNGFQANAETEDLIPLEPLAAKFKAFGWQVARVDGHDFDKMDHAFVDLLSGATGPTVMIADTVRGKGLPSMERRADRWFVSLTDTEAERLLIELRGEP